MQTIQDRLEEAIRSRDFTGLRERVNNLLLPGWEHRRHMTLLDHLIRPQQQRRREGDGFAMRSFAVSTSAAANPKSRP